MSGQAYPCPPCSMIGRSSTCHGPLRADSRARRSGSVWPLCALSTGLIMALCFFSAEPRWVLTLQVKRFPYYTRISDQLAPYALSRQYPHNQTVF
jgi:hypothetical protein